jgi:hypothetical protein
MTPFPGNARLCLLLGIRETLQCRITTTYTALWVCMDIRELGITFYPCGFKGKVNQRTTIGTLTVLSKGTRIRSHVIDQRML